VDDDVLYIGIDASLTGTGVVILQDDRSIVKAVCITSKPSSDLPRVDKIASTVLDLVKSYADDKKVYVIFESIPFSRNPTGKSFTRHNLVFLLQWLFAKEGIETFSVTPTTIKNKFVGHGHAEKKAVIAAIHQKYRHTIKNDNIADAFAAADLLIAFIAKKLKLPIVKSPRL
jgi:Holliday junction resolvasome RuvABC endonuclease subunit